MNVNATFAGMVERNLLFFVDMTQGLDETNYDALDPYRDNLYRAISFGAQSPNDNLTAALLVLNCTLYIEQRCNYRHWAKLITRIANRYQSDDSVTLAKLLSTMGYFRYQAGELKKAEQAYHSAEKIALQSEDNLAVATAWYYLGIMHYQRNEIDSAKLLTTRSLGILQELKRDSESLKLLGYLLNLSALIKMEAGEFAAAENDLLFASETLTQNASQPHHFIRYNLAKLRIHQNRFTDAENLLKTQIDYCTHNDLPASYAKTITRLTYLYIKQEKWTDALEACIQLDIVDLQKRGHLIEFAMAKNNLGYIHFRLNYFEKAEAYLIEAVQAWKLLQHDLEIANSLASLASVQLAQRMFTACKLSCTQAMKHLNRSSQESVRATEVHEEILEILRSLEERTTFN